MAHERTVNPRVLIRLLAGFLVAATLLLLVVGCTSTVDERTDNETVSQAVLTGTTVVESTEVPTSTLDPFAIPGNWKRVSARQGVFGMDGPLSEANFSIAIPESWGVFDLPMEPGEMPQGTITGFAQANGGGEQPNLSYRFIEREQLEYELQTLELSNNRKIEIEEIDGIRFHISEITRGYPFAGIGALIESIPGADGEVSPAVMFEPIGRLGGYPLDEMRVAIRSIEFAPPYVRISTPEIGAMPDKGWEEPEFIWTGSMTARPPFSLLAPVGTAFIGIQGIDSRGGTIISLGLNIAYRSGDPGVSNFPGSHLVPGLAVPARRYWEETHDGLRMYFWREVDENGEFIAGPSILGAHIFRGPPRPHFSTNVNTLTFTVTTETTEQAELVLAVVRTIR